MVCKIYPELSAGVIYILSTLEAREEDKEEFEEEVELGIGGTSRIGMKAHFAFADFRFVISFIILIRESTSMTVANQLLKKHVLNNAYFAMRHGNSMANQMKIISSDPVISTVQHGLSDLGHEQAEKAASDFVRRFQETSQTVRYSWLI